MKTVMRFVYTALAATVFASAAGAEPVCVVCSGPDQTYTCSVSDAAGGSVRASSMFCMQHIADEHNHASCAAVKTQSCEGQPKVYIANDVETAGIARQNEPGSPHQAETNEKAPTLVDVTKETVQQSGATVKKAGEKIGEAGQTVGEAIKSSGQAVGDAAKKTWRCIGSGLKEC